MANEPNEVRDVILRRLRTEKEKEVTLANNLLGEMTRYLLHTRSRAEKETKVHSLPLDQLLSRLFWLCACDAPSEVVSVYFDSMLAPNLEAFSSAHAPVLRAFCVASGIDVELSIMRTFGYMLTKCLMLKEVGVGLQLLTPSCNVGFSYAAETHGLWVLKGYAPLMAMARCCSKVNDAHSLFESKESVLKYALAHQQVEVLVQLEYSVEFKENYIKVHARIDNIRVHVAKVGFNKDEENVYMNERNFPSRV
ncbi:hypothetical protein Tco_1469399, partial [Tanacetum coccineum]